MQIEPETNNAQDAAPSAERAAGASALTRRAVVIEERLTIADAAAIAMGEAVVLIGPRAEARIAAARGRLARCIEDRRLVYGLTTGFGPLANRITDPADIETLQRHLIYHLASGVGAPLGWAAARATALARLASIAQGWSGASDQAVALLLAVLNSDLAPWIPEKGTVGASGDLTPLSHLALALMGEGRFIDRDGRDAPNREAFARFGLAPLTLAQRDGLALVNGVSAMTGVALLNAARARRLIERSEALQVAHSELLRGRAEAWRPEFASARPHPGQIAATQALNDLAAGSDLLRREPAAERVLPEGMGAATEPAPLQDPYSTRCAPQILGAVRDVAAFHAETVERELNAASDNPIFIEDAPHALHGGNFMGCHVALASDALLNGVVALAGHAERRIARLCDETKNGGLPAFLHRGAPGLNSGFMGAQVTATALLAEMRARAGAGSIQSLTTNGDNQDVVSMGTIAARGVAAALEDAWRILAIEALAVAQGVDIVAAREPSARFSASTRALHAEIRAQAPPLLQDRPLHAEIEALAR
ncbi:MAG: aromatic amino acid ammonia-lyase [Pseudomonadota bacterium]